MNSEVELVCLWLVAVVLEPDSTLVFNDTAELEQGRHPELEFSFPWVHVCTPHTHTIPLLLWSYSFYFCQSFPGQKLVTVNRLFLSTLGFILKDILFNVERTLSKMLCIFLSISSLNTACCFLNGMYICLSFLSVMLRQSCFTV